MVLVVMHIIEGTQVDGAGGRTQHRGWEEELTHSLTHSHSRWCAAGRVVLMVAHSTEGYSRVTHVCQ